MLSVLSALVIQQCIERGGQGEGQEESHGLFYWRYRSDDERTNTFLIKELNLSAQRLRRELKKRHDIDILIRQVSTTRVLFAMDKHNLDELCAMIRLRTGSSE